MLKRWLGCGALVGAAVGCSTWPETRMVPVEDYAMADKVSVSGQPAYTAGPSYVVTAAPDGSTYFVDCGGRMQAALPGTRQTC